MKLYKLGYDNNFKYFVSDNIMSSIEDIDNKELIKLSIYEEGINKRDDFNITLISPYIFVREDVKILIENLNLKARFIKSQCCKGDFYLFFPEKSLRIINCKNEYDLMDMVFQNKYKFIKGIDLKNIYFFKEDRISSMVFFTSEFVEMFEGKLYGVIFEEYNEI